MALFHNYTSQKKTVNRFPKKKVFIIEKPRYGRLADFMARLDILHQQTHKHPLPVKMKFIAASATDKGQPMAVYACPFPDCNWREGWVQDIRTGKPICLWNGFYNGR